MRLLERVITPKTGVENNWTEMQAKIKADEFGKKDYFRRPLRVVEVWKDLGDSTLQNLGWGVLVDNTQILGVESYAVIIK
jgi:hypothetical protein